MMSGKEKFQLEALREEKRALKGTIFQYITVQYICSKYHGTYLSDTLPILKKGLGELHI